MRELFSVTQYACLPWVTQFDVRPTVSVCGENIIWAGGGGLTAEVAQHDGLTQTESSLKTNVWR